LEKNIGIWQIDNIRYENQVFSNIDINLTK
jgi:hypothetical protein